MTNRKLILVMFCYLLILAAAVFGQQSTSLEKSTVENNSGNKPTLEEDESYLISPGDMLDIRVFNRPQFSRETVRVNEAGRIRMPFIENEIQAACMSERELANRIVELYKEYIRTPQVDVMIKEYQSDPVAVLGSVKNPSRLQLQRRRQIRLLDLLAFVGGPTEKAGRFIQVIYSKKDFSCELREEKVINEKIDSKSEVEISGETSFFKLKDTLNADNNSNPFIKPGDIVILPEADQVLVIGNVIRPSALLLQERMTISQAIAMSGGLLPDTKHDKVRIVRQKPGSAVKTELIVDLKAIEKQKTEDIVLEANDIVDVPVSGGKRLLKSFLGAIIPSIGQLPVRVIP